MPGGQPGSTPGRAGLKAGGEGLETAEGVAFPELRYPHPRLEATAQWDSMLLPEAREPAVERKR